VTFESSKTLSGLGALLLFISAIVLFVLPTAALVVGIAGLLMLLVGLNGLAGYYKERGIFNNALFSVIIAVVGAVLVFVIAVYVTLSSVTPILNELYPGWNGDWASLPNMTPNPDAFTSGDISTILPFLTGLAAIWVITWVVAIISSFFARRALNAIGQKSGTGLFGTAGLVILIGAFLGIVFFGYLLLWIGLLLAAIAFFQLRPSAPVEPTYTAAPPEPTTL